MMKAHHAACPSCGAALTLDGDRRVTRCAWCRSKILVEIEGAVPRFWFPPAVSREEAKLAVLRSLADPMMPEGLRKNASPGSFGLVFVPFYFFRGRRLGMLTTGAAAAGTPGGPPAETRTVEAGEFGLTFSYRQTVRGPGIGDTGKAVDSRVIFNAFSAVGIATDLPGWGLDRIDVGKALERGVKSSPVSVRDMQKLGDVYEVTRPSERFVAERTRLAETQDVSVKVETIVEALQVFYYPAWLARYTYRGQAYRAAVDALTGSVLYLRAPQSDRHRFPMMLAILALLAWPASKLARMIFLSDAPGTLSVVVGYSMVVLWPLTLTMTALVVLVLYMMWMNYRYPGEVVVTPGGREVEKIGKPAVTWFDRLFEWVDDSFQKMARRAAQRGWRGGGWWGT